MQRDEGDALQALFVDRAPIGEPIIVGPGERDRVIRLAHPRQHQPARRIDDLEIDALAVGVGEVLRRVLGLLLDLAVLVPVEAVARVNKAALAVLLGETLAVHALVIDGVAVGIDDQHAVFHRGGPPGYILSGSDDTTGGARPATRAWSGERSPSEAGSLAAAATATGAARGHFRELGFELGRTIAPIEERLFCRLQGSLLVLAEPVLPDGNVKQAALQAAKQALLDW